jgi:hypothetical protein
MSCLTNGSTRSMTSSSAPNGPGSDRARALWLQLRRKSDGRRVDWSATKSIRSRPSRTAYAVRPHSPANHILGPGGNVSRVCCLTGSRGPDFDNTCRQSKTLSASTVGACHSSRFSLFCMAVSERQGLAS